MFDETKFMVDSAYFHDDMDEVDDEDVVDTEIVVSDMSGFNIEEEDFDNSDDTVGQVENICKDDAVEIDDDEANGVEEETEEEPLVDAEDYAITCSVTSATDDTLDDVDDEQ